MIQTPKYKKKNVTVADVVAPKIPKQNKKKNVEPAPEPGIAQSNIEKIESLTVVEQVIAETPKVPKKRAPKKKVEPVVVVPEQTVVIESNIENIESLFGNMTLEEVPVVVLSLIHI